MQYISMKFYKTQYFIETRWNEITVQRVALA